MAAEVSSMVAACLVVRSERSLAPERISLVAVFSARERIAQLGDDLGEAVGDAVGVVLEPARRRPCSRPSCAA